MPKCQIYEHGDGSGRLAIKTPYNAGFVEALKNTVPPADRKYDGTQRIWIIEPTYFNDVAALIKKYFNEVIQGDMNLKLADPFGVMHLKDTAPEWLAQVVYKALVKKMHPDVGGSHDQMILLNVAWKQVKEYYSEPAPF